MKEEQQSEPIEKPQYQIRHTKGWSDISDAEYDVYKNSNAELREKPYYNDTAPLPSKADSMEESGKLYVNSLDKEITSGRMISFLNTYKAGATEQEAIMKKQYIKVSDHHKALWDAHTAGVIEQQQLQSGAEWVEVDEDLDINSETNLQSYEKYFIVVAETGKVEQAVFIEDDTENFDHTWQIFDKEYPLTYASHYQQVIYPEPPLTQLRNKQQ